MDKLPIETLSQFCRYLDDTFKPSLFAFSLVNRRCRSAACAWIFRTVHISVTGPVQLQQNVERWLQVLRSASSIQHVRALEIEGRMSRTTTSHNNTDQGQGWTPWLREYNQHDVFSQVSHSMNNCIDLAPPAVVQEDDESWKPIANLIDQLPGLADVTYAALNLFSPCLLESLQRHEPYCRLHYLTFSLRSLVTKDSSPLMDPYEFKLATSPCLYSIALRHEHYTTGGHRNLNEDGLMLLASGVAPNLSKVAMWRENPGDSIELRQALTNHTARGANLQKVLRHTSGMKGRLICLDLGGCGVITLQTLQAWDRHIEFVALQTLKLHNFVEAPALAYLATSSSFLSLTSLVLDVQLGHIEDLWPQEYVDAVQELFHRIPPLRALQISDDLGMLSLGTILARHGGSLHRFHLSPTGCTNPNRRLITAQTVCAIAEACPMIGDLMLSLRRCRGGAEEAAGYRALRSFPRLQSLTLYLDCSNTSIMQNGDLDEVPNDPSFDEEDQQLFEWPGERIRNGHIRDAMINSAVDESLAKAIFQTISRGEQSGAFQLEVLKLHVIGVGEFGSRWWLVGLDNFFGAFRRSWICRSNPSSKHDVFIEEVHKSRREEMEKRVGLHLDDDLETIFRKIWPKGTGEWWRDWRSWPLDTAQVWRFVNTRLCIKITSLIVSTQ